MRQGDERSAAEIAAVWLGDGGADTFRSKELAQGVGHSVPIRGALTALTKKFTICGIR